MASVTLPPHGFNHFYADAPYLQLPPICYQLPLHLPGGGFESPFLLKVGFPTMEPPIPTSRCLLPTLHPLNLAGHAYPYHHTGPKLPSPSFLCFVSKIRTVLLRCSHGLGGFQSSQTWGAIATANFRILHHSQAQSL